jgi:putative transposase
MDKKAHIHLVYSTKGRIYYFNRDRILKLREFFMTQAPSIGIELIEADGIKNHIHCLIYVDKSVDLPQIVKSMKGASSRWFNQMNFFPGHFRWSVGYYAARVENQHLQRVIRYIQNQDVDSR